MRVDCLWLITQTATAASVLAAFGHAVVTLRFRGWTTIFKAVTGLAVSLWGLFFAEFGWQRISALSTGLAPSLTWAALLSFLLGLLGMGCAVGLMVVPRLAATIAVAVLAVLDVVVIQQLLVADRPVRGLVARIVMASLLAVTATAVAALFLRKSTPGPQRPSDGT